MLSYKYVRVKCPNIMTNKTLSDGIVYMLQGAFVNLS